MNKPDDNYWDSMGPPPPLPDGLRESLGDVERLKKIPECVFMYLPDGSTTSANRLDMIRIAKGIVDAYDAYFERDRVKFERAIRSAYGEVTDEGKN